MSKKINTKNPVEKSPTMIETEIQKETDRLMNIKFTISNLEQKLMELQTTNNQVSKDTEQMKAYLKEAENVKKQLEDRNIELSEKEREMNLNSGRKAKKILEQANIKFKDADEKQIEAEKKLKEAEQFSESLNKRDSQLINKEKQLLKVNDQVSIIKKEIKLENKRKEALLEQIEWRTKTAEEDENNNAIKKSKVKQWEDSLKERETKINEEYKINEKKLDEVTNKLLAINDWESKIDMKGMKVDKLIIVFNELQARLTSTLGSKVMSDNVLKEFEKHLETKYGLNVKLNN